MAVHNVTKRDNTLIFRGFSRLWERSQEKERRKEILPMKREGEELNLRLYI